jgi:hypothetical protein
VIGAAASFFDGVSRTPTSDSWLACIFPCGSWDSAATTDEPVSPAAFSDETSHASFSDDEVTASETDEDLLPWGIRFLAIADLIAHFLPKTPPALRPLLLRIEDIVHFNPTLLWLERDAPLSLARVAEEKGDNVPLFLEEIATAVYRARNEIINFPSQGRTTVRRALSEEDVLYVDRMTAVSHILKPKQWDGWDWEEQALFLKSERLDAFITRYGAQQLLRFFEPSFSLDFGDISSDDLQYAEEKSMCLAVYLPIAVHEALFTAFDSNSAEETIETTYVIPNEVFKRGSVFTNVRRACSVIGKTGNIYLLPNHRAAISFDENQVTLYAFTETKVIYTGRVSSVEVVELMDKPFSIIIKDDLLLNLLVLTSSNNFEIPISTFQGVIWSVVHTGALLVQTRRVPMRLDLETFELEITRFPEETNPPSSPVTILGGLYY